MEIVDGEVPVVRESVELICRAVGVEAPVRWGLVAKCNCGRPDCLGDYTMGAAYVNGERGFIVSPGLEKRFSTEQLFGIVCHEVGHLKYVDIYRDHRDLTVEQIYEAEFRADRFAIQMGMAKGLRDALQLILDKDPYDRDTDTHPSTAKRVARLNAYLESRRN